jgi:hypothetical protein
MTRVELALLRLAAFPASALAAPFCAGTLGRERAGGLAQASSIDIDASPQTAHALLDPGSSFHRWRLRNERIEAIDARAGRFRYHAPVMEDRPFEIRVTRSTPPTVIETNTFAEDRRPFGAVLSSTGLYEIEPTNSGGCRVKLTETTIFLAGMPPYERARHAIMMLAAIRMDLLRLKYEAETGRDADARAA